jgi:hypothetical protein
VVGFTTGLKRRSTREERKPVTRDDDDDNNNRIISLEYIGLDIEVMA